MTVGSAFFGLSQIAGSQIVAITAALRIDELLSNQSLQQGSIEITATAAFKFNNSSTPN
jgi:hypothetical protein